MTNEFIYNYNLLVIFIKYNAIVMIIAWALYVTNILEEKPIILLKIDYIIKIIFAIYLIYKFNKYNKNFIFNELDRKIIFSVGVYMILLSLANILDIYSNILRKYFSKYTYSILPIKKYITQNIFTQFNIKN